MTNGDDNHEPTAEEAARELYKLVGFDPPEISALVAATDMGPTRVAYIMIQRLAERVTLMEEYLRRKIEEDRRSRIIKPGFRN